MEKADIAAVVKTITSNIGAPQIFSLTVPEFRDVYQGVQREHQGTPVDILLNGDWAVAQFSRLSAHRVRITQEEQGKPRFRLGGRKLLTEKDFEFALLYSQLHGARQPLTVCSFLREELSANWLVLVLTFGLCVAAFLLLGAATTTTSGEPPLARVNEVVLSAATLYLGVFVLFTVPQNTRLLEDISLFRSGQLHRFLRIDSLLARLALIAMGLTLSSIVLLNTPSVGPVSLLGRSLAPNPPSLVPFTTALAVTMLVDCVLSLLYYFDRTRLLAEKDLTQRLLDQISTEQNVRPQPATVRGGNGSIKASPPSGGPASESLPSEPQQ